MKQGIHPEYRPVIFLDTSANHAFLTRSAIDTKGRETMKWEDGKEYPVVKLEVSSESHSFYTGKKKILGGDDLPPGVSSPAAAVAAQGARAHRAGVRPAGARRPRAVEIARRHRPRHRL